MRRTNIKGNKYCPDVHVMSDFKLNDFKGKWYEVFTSIPPSATKSKCEFFSFTPTIYGSLSVYRKYITMNGLEIKMMGVAAELEKSAINMFYPAYPIDAKSYDVLDTDYKNYALLYICDTDYNVWILSRNSSITREHLKPVLNDLALQGLTNFYLYPTDQQNFNCRLRQIPPCLENDEIVRPFINNFNYTRFSNSTWFDIFAYEHPFNLNSKCVRTTFLRAESSTRRSLFITNFVDSIGLLTRVYGVASWNSQSIGYNVSYFALPDLSTEFSVLDVVYTNYILLHSCINKRNAVWMLSRKRYLEPYFIDRAVNVLEQNGLSISLLQEIEQALLSELKNDIDSEIIDINLPRNHLSQFFNNIPKFTKKLNQTGNKFYKEFLNSAEYDKEICWGYEYECKKPYHVHKCPGNHSGYVSSKEAQFDVFHAQADFGFIKDQRKQMFLYCEPYRFDDSSLECSKYLRFCRGRNLMFNFTDLVLRKEPFRWDNNVLKKGDIGGYCNFNERLFNEEEQMSHMSALQSWAPELKNFVSLDKRPIANNMCDVIIEKPTFLMKIDSTYNMYHHFCDFFNLYASQHLNFTHQSSFSTDIQILIWETYDYYSPFAQVFSVFSENDLLTLNNFKGQKVCFKNIVFPLLPRMIFGLYYNTPLINGCENSALFQTFSEHILHRLHIKRYPPIDKKIRITFLSRNTRYRNVLNEKELIKRISKNEDYDVRRVVYDKNIKFIDQLKITQNSDIFIGMHGAGLTHLLFLPKWATLFELYNCGDPNCYKDLARLRGVNYITWEDDAFLESFEAGYSEPGHEKFKNYKFDADEFGRLVAKAVKNVKNHPDYKEYIKKIQKHDEL